MMLALWLALDVRQTSISAAVCAGQHAVAQIRGPWRRDRVGHRPLDAADGVFDELLERGRPSA
jgi:hypothetical protein